LICGSAAYLAQPRTAPVCGASCEAQGCAKTQFISAVETSAEECPGQQSRQPPAARMEAPQSPESPPEPIPVTAAIAGPAPGTAAALLQDPLPTQAAARGW